MPLQIDLSNVIAILALLLSCYATWKTFKLNRRQESLVESQKTLNELLVDKSKGEALSKKQADLGVSFIKLGRFQWRLKIWNKGESSARNVRIEIPEEDHIFSESEIKEKFPLEKLEKHESVELMAGVTLASKRKHIIKLIWSDDYSDKNEKILYPTL